MQNKAVKKGLRLKTTRLLHTGANILQKYVQISMPPTNLIYN